jgi:hypothetical protein
VSGTPSTTGAFELRHQDDGPRLAAQRCALMRYGLGTFGVD